MTDNNETPKLNGCGWAALLTVGTIVLAFIVAILFILVNFGSFLGGL